ARAQSGGPRAGLALLSCAGAPAGPPRGGAADCRLLKVAHALQVNSFVRNGQLKMAKELKPYGRAASSGERTYAGQDPRFSLSVMQDLTSSNRSLDFYGGAFFNTSLSSVAHCDHQPEEHELLAEVLPPYSDYTAESRELLHTRTSDDDWSWCETRDKTEGGKAGEQAG